MRPKGERSESIQLPRPNNGEHSLMRKPHAVTVAYTGSSPVAYPKQRVDSSTGRAPGSYPGGCEVGTRSIHQTDSPVAQIEERRSYKAEGGGASPPRVTTFDGNAVTPS